MCLAIVSSLVLLAAAPGGPPTIPNVPGEFGLPDAKQAATGPGIVRIFLEDAFGNLAPAEVFIFDDVGGARLEIRQTLAKAGPAPVLATVLSPRRVQQLRAFRATVLSAPRLGKELAQRRRSSNPEEFIVCTDAWGAMVEVAGEGRVTTRTRHGCQVDGLFQSVVAFAGAAIEDFPDCARLDPTQYGGDVKRLQFCLRLTGRRDWAAEVTNRVRVLLGRPLHPPVDITDRLAEHVSFAWPDAAPVTGADAVAAAWKSKAPELYLTIEGVNAGADGRVVVTGSAERDGQIAPVIQVWVFERGQWRVESWRMGELHPRRDPPNAGGDIE